MMNEMLRPTHAPLYSALTAHIVLLSPDPMRCFTRKMNTAFEKSNMFQLIPRATLQSVFNSIPGSLATVPASITLPLDYRHAPS